MVSLSTGLPVFKEDAISIILIFFITFWGSGTRDLTERTHSGVIGPDLVFYRVGLSTQNRVLNSSATQRGKQPMGTCLRIKIAKKMETVA